MRPYILVWFSLLAAGGDLAQAIDSQSTPRPVPLTRPEMKKYLEDMKTRKPRIPLPELTEEEKAKAAEQAANPGAGGGRGSFGYEGRLRSLYLPAGEGLSFGGGGGRRTDNVPGGAARTRPSGTGFQQNADDNMSLDYKFNVAKKLAASPVILTDDDTDLALKLTGPRDVVQLISYVTTRASFDRITEAAGLQLEK